MKEKLPRETEKMLRSWLDRNGFLLILTDCFGNFYPQEDATLAIREKLNMTFYAGNSEEASGIGDS